MSKLPFQPGDQLEAKTIFGDVSALIVAICHETGRMFIKFESSIAPREIADIVERVKNGTLKVIKAEENMA